MKSKDEQIQRHLAGAKKAKSRDERKLIEENKKQRGGSAGRRKRARNDWSEYAEDELEDDELFQRIERAPQTDLTGTKRTDTLAAAEKSDPKRPHELELQTAIVVAPHGRRVRLWFAGSEVTADVGARVPAGILTVGDVVRVETPAQGVLRVVARDPRRSELTRPDPGNPHLRRAIAANIDIGVVVLAAGGRKLKTGLVDRLWVNLSLGRVRTVLAINKIDLWPDAAECRILAETAELYEAVGLSVHCVSATSGEGLDGLAHEIAGRTAVFAGQSGVGKSSLLNALDPSGARHVQEVRAGDLRGRHTTTSSTMRELPDGTRVIDTPGVRAFGLAGVRPEDLVAAFPDIEDLAADCQFRGCRHDGVQGCAVEEATTNDPSFRVRYDAYRRMLDDLEEHPSSH